MENIAKLLQIENPYSPISKEDDHIFELAMQENHCYLMGTNEKYAKYCNGLMKMIPVAEFKKQDFEIEFKEDGDWFTSSGTTSRIKSKVFIDKSSMARIINAEIKIFTKYNIISNEESNFLILAPDPAYAAELAYANNFNKLTMCAPVKEKIFAVDIHNNLNINLIIKKLKEWSKTDNNVYIFGLTIFFERLVTNLDKSIEFKGSIKSITGGGWKSLTKTMTHDEIIQFFKKKLISSNNNVYNYFGLTEHPLHYISCSEGNFHIPKYSRFQIIDSNYKSSPKRKKGLIRLKNPFLTSYPYLDILTEDIGYWGENCSCGLSLPYITYIEKATTSEGTCAYTATQSH